MGNAGLTRRVRPALPVPPSGGEDARVSSAAQAAPLTHGTHACVGTRLWPFLRTRRPRGRTILPPVCEWPAPGRRPLDYRWEISGGGELKRPPSWSRVHHARSWRTAASYPSAPFQAGRRIPRARRGDQHIFSVAERWSAQRATMDARRQAHQSLERQRQVKAWRAKRQRAVSRGPRDDGLASGVRGGRGPRAGA